MILKQNEAGFTLVELAIVMIIIGLLIGGILKGQELVANARTTAIIKTIKGTEAATLTFKDRYAYLPGDVAASKVLGCDATNNCIGGDENGVVGNTSIGGGAWWTMFIGTQGMRMESTQFWKHLALVNMITGVDPSADPVTDAQFGVTHPTTPFGGGLEVYYDGRTTIGFEGHIIRISQDGVSNTASGILTPSQAATIDRKLDDGHPDQGIILADYGVINNNCKQNGMYRENNNSVCLLYISLLK